MPAQKMQHTIAEIVFRQKTARFLLLRERTVLFTFFRILYIFMYIQEK